MFNVCTRVMQCLSRLRNARAEVGCIIFVNTLKDVKSAKSVLSVLLLLGDLAYSQSNMWAADTNGLN